jgi:threonine dehydratase
MLDRVIDHGLAADGRRWRFTTRISDRPGGVARLTAVIAATGASVKEIVHDRLFSGADIFSTAVEVTVETADRAHVATLVERLRAEGFPVAAAARPSETAG